MGNPPGEGGRPLAFRAQDDRGAAYAAAVERSEAAFAHVRRALGGRARMVNTGAELAAVAAALPPEVSVLLDGVMRIPAGDAASRVKVGLAQCSIVESLVWPDAVVDVAEAGGLHR
jgi:hypothetical protein